MQNNNSNHVSNITEITSKQKSINFKGKSINSKIDIYPNPNKGQFTLALSNTNSDNLVEIYDVMGKKIWSKAVLTNKELIDISNQPKGIYLVKVVNGHNLITQKIVYN